MYTAMLVDDEKWTMLGLCRTFRWAAYGFELAYSTTDPDAALERLLAAPTDAAFLDIRMPGLSGLDIMTRAREAGLTTEFVIISGIQDFAYARTCLKYAAFDYCLKPLTQQQADQTLSQLKAQLDRQGKGGHFSPSSTPAAAHTRLVASYAPPLPAQEDSFSQLVGYVTSHLEQPLQLKALAQQFYLTPNYVSSLFRERMDTTFSAYLNTVRLNKAVQLLRNTRLSVEEVARLCGYSDAQYFIRVFRSRMQVTPLQYRKGLGE